jgi:hypothetical protein
MKTEFSGQIFKKTQISNSIKICPVGSELLHVKRQTDITNLIAAFRNFVKRLKMHCDGKIPFFKGGEGVIM